MKKWICRAALLVAALLVPVAGLQARDKKEKAEQVASYWIIEIFFQCHNRQYIK